MGSYIDHNGNYYEGDRARWDHREATKEEIIQHKEIVENAQRDAAIKTVLVEIDLKSIRSIREWIAGDDGVRSAALTYLSEREAEAKLERAKLLVKEA